MAGPEDMRRAVAGYVQEIHRSYVDQARTFPPAVRGRMPLLAGGPLTVAAVAARNLHLIATRESLGPLQGPEVSVEAEYEGLAWTAALLRPGRHAGPRSRSTRAPVRRSTRSSTRSGVTTVVYHLVAQAGAGLSGAPGEPRRHRPGERALGGGPRLRDDPQPGPRPGGARRRAGRARRRPASVRAQALLAARHRPATTGRSSRSPRGRTRPRRCAQGAARPRRRADRSGTPPGRRRVVRPASGRRERRDAGRLSTVRNAARLLKVFLVREEPTSASPSWPAGSAWARVDGAPAAHDARRGGADRAGPAHRRLPARHRDVRARRGGAGAPRPARRGGPGARASCASRPASRPRSACSTAPRSSTSTGWRARSRCGCSPRPAAGCRCTAPAPARCCWPTCRTTTGRRCWPGCPLTPLTPHTITEPGPLRAELRPGPPPRLGRGGQRARDRRRLGRGADPRRGRRRRRRDPHRRAGDPARGGPSPAGSAPASSRRARRSSRRLGWSPEAHRSQAAAPAPALSLTGRTGELTCR